MKTITLSDEQFEVLENVLADYQYTRNFLDLEDLMEHIDGRRVWCTRPPISGRMTEPKPEAKVRKRCDNCKYIGSNGYCKRYPPVRDAVSLLIHADWCGEFKQKQKKGVMNDEDIQDIERSMKYPS